MRFQANTKRTAQSIWRCLYVNLKYQYDVETNLVDHPQEKSTTQAQWLLGKSYHIHVAYISLSKGIFLPGCSLLRA
jgi:hypothetical protein